MNQKEKRPVRDKQVQTMLDAMADMVGCIKDGPSNLSQRHKFYYRQAMFKKHGNARIA